MLEQSHFKSKEFKDNQKKKLDLTIAYMEVILHGDDNAKIEDLRKLRMAGIYYSPRL